MTTEPIINTNPDHYNAQECKNLIFCLAPAADFGGDTATVSGYIYACLDADFAAIDQCVAAIPATDLEPWTDQDGDDLIYPWEDWSTVSNIVDQLSDSPAFGDMARPNDTPFAGHAHYEWVNAINDGLTDADMACFVEEMRYSLVTYPGDAGYDLSLTSLDFDPNDCTDDEDEAAPDYEPSYWDYYGRDYVTGTTTDILSAFYTWTCWEGGYNADVAEGYYSALMGHCAVAMAERAGIDTGGIDQYGCTFVESLGY